VPARRGQAPAWPGAGKAKGRREPAFRALRKLHNDYFFTATWLERDDVPREQRFLLTSICASVLMAPAR
jgi:hypothetical protein